MFKDGPEASLAACLGKGDLLGKILASKDAILSSNNIQMLLILYDPDQYFAHWSLNVGSPLRKEYHYVSRIRMSFVPHFWHPLLSPSASRRHVSMTTDSRGTPPFEHRIEKRSRWGAHGLQRV